MNRAAVSIIVCLAALLLISLSACSAEESSRATAVPQLQIIGQLSSNTPPVPTAILTLTPSPTPLPSRTPLPTPRQVVVSRISDSINPALVTPIAEGVALPDLVITDINGEEIHLNELNRPLVLNFWSVGCGSCFFEFPVLQAFYEHHGADHISIIGINIADFADETRIIAEQLHIQFPVVVDKNAEFFATYFQGAVVPTTIFIKADGTVSNVVIGPLDAYNLDLELQKIGLPAYE